MKRPAFWILLGLVSLAATAAAVHYFPQAFSIVALDITMTRERALDDARTIVTRDRLGPADSRQAASFALDSETQTFVELEGGGKTEFTRMLRERLYAAYTWRVRHFREGETNETLVRFTPDGQPYGFVETLKEDAPGAALDAAEARRRAEADASTRWRVDLSPFALVEQGQERRPGGRVDHTLTYERSSPTLGEGRYRLRLVVSGDRLTEVTHFVKIPEAFTRRYGSMRSANEAIGIGSLVGMVLLYVVGGIGIGLFFMLRQRYVLWRPAAIWGVIVGTLQALATLNEWPLMWMTYDTAVPRTTFIAGQIADARRHGGGILGVHGAVVHGGRNTDAPRVRPSPSVLARVGEGTWKLDRHSRPDGRGLSARVDVLRVRRRALPHRHACLRVVDAFRSAAPSRRAGDLRALALGDRQFAPGRVLGRVPVPRRSARRRRPHRRPVRKARALSRRSRSSSRPSSSVRDTRRIRRSLPLRARSSSSFRRSDSGCSTSTSAFSPASSCTSRSMSSGSPCQSFCRMRQASGSSKRWSSS